MPIFLQAHLQSVCVSKEERSPQRPKGFHLPKITAARAITTPRGHAFDKAAEVSNRKVCTASTSKRTTDCHRHIPGFVNVNAHTVSGSGCSPTDLRSKPPYCLEDHDVGNHNSQKSKIDQRVLLANDGPDPRNLGDQGMVTSLIRGTAGDTPAMLKIRRCR